MVVPGNIGEMKSVLSMHNARNRDFIYFMTNRPIFHQVPRLYLSTPMTVVSAALLFSLPKCQYSSVSFSLASR